MSEWVTFVGVVVPLLTMAGSSVAFIMKYFSESSQRRNDDFFELMNHLDAQDQPLAGKLAAVYHLRNYPEHKEFILRFCTSAKTAVTGPAADALRQELNETQKYFEMKS